MEKATYSTNLYGTDSKVGPEASNKLKSLIKLGSGPWGPAAVAMTICRKSAKK